MSRAPGCHSSSTQYSAAHFPESTKNATETYNVADMWTFVTMEICRTSGTATYALRRVGRTQILWKQEMLCYACIDRFLQSKSRYPSRHPGIKVNFTCRLCFYGCVFYHISPLYLFFSLFSFFLTFFILSFYPFWADLCCLHGGHICITFCLSVVRTWQNILENNS